jgi:hypothetical protein
LSWLDMFWRGDDYRQHYGNIFVPMG